jgi:endonuclease/exonuclease/phosphatase family metal-dependent hydrolase
MEPKRLRIISWNVNGRNAWKEQVMALRRRRLDVVALQEVKDTDETRASLKHELKRIGLGHAVDSSYSTGSRAHLPRYRRYCELIASRWPAAPLPPGEFDVPWPERVLSVVITSLWGQIEVHTAHIPCGASHEWLKIDTLKGIFRRLACQLGRYRILCGDFNTPQEESLSGRVLTWGQYRRRNGEIALHKEWGKRWDKGKRDILEGLAGYDLADVYRRLHGYKDRRGAFSWCWRGKSPCRRFDHVFASGSLNAIECKYLHRLREKGLSDHSAIESAFEPTKKRFA